MSLAEEIYSITKQGEFEKDWGLKNQIQRAAISIPSNIAEGFERYSDVLKDVSSFPSPLPVSLP